jgi:choline-sulfatase
VKQSSDLPPDAEAGVKRPDAQHWDGRRIGLATTFAGIAALVVGTLESSKASALATDSGNGLSLWLATTGLWVAPCVACGLISVLLTSWLCSGVSGKQRSAKKRLLDAIKASLPGLWIGFGVMLIWGALAARLLPLHWSVARGGAVYGCVVLVSLVAGVWASESIRLRWKDKLRSISTWVTVILAALPFVLFLGLIQLGETSGIGAPLSLWGVLRREELDLSLPLYVWIALASGVVAVFVSWRLPTTVSAAFVLALIGLVLGSRSMSTAFALQLEQAGSMSARVLRGYQRLSDRDGDGFAATFGGGDCNDGDAAIQPEAADIAGNGIDEDCSGSDATVNPVDGVVAPGSDVSATGAGSSGIGPSASAQAGESNIPTPSTLPQEANIVFITIDTLRYDLGYAGNPRPLSPNLDKLAAKALVYDHAYALASYTSKSLGPLMIGRYGSETNRGWMHFNKYPTSDVMVQERLSRAGIFTLSVQGHWYFKADTGLGRGFDVLDMSAAPTRPQGEGDKTVNSEQLSDAAIALLKQPARNEQQFFMWVHYLDPHAEYVTHADFNFGTNGRAKYDAEIAFTDHHVGRLLAAIEAANFSKRTIIVVTSDHGEAFGEHGLIRHGFELWEELVRVPLLVYVPGGQPKRITARRSAIDLVPTFLDVMGVPLPQGNDDFLSGHSLKDEWSGGPSPARPVFVDMPAGPYNGDRQAYIEDDVKLIVSNSRPMGLYNLASDPGETKNLSKETAQVDAMLERLKAFRSNLRVIKVKPQ